MLHLDILGYAKLGRFLLKIEVIKKKEIIESCSPNPKFVKKNPERSTQF